MKIRPNKNIPLYYDLNNEESIHKR